MDALAEIWSRSGKKPDDLYKGKMGEIFMELKAWLVAREARNHANFGLLWDFLDNNATIIDLASQYANINDIRIAPFKAKHVKKVERIKDCRDARDKLTLRADYLLSTLDQRGMRWVGLPYTPQWTEMDSQVCAFLKTVDPSFDAEEQLENLEMKEDIAEWWLQKTRQEAVSAAAGAVLMVERESADDHATIPHKRITAAFVFGQDAQDTSTNSGVASVDISGLLPSTPPGPEDRPTGTIAPARLDTIEEEPAEIEESAETLARRIEGMTTTEEQISLEKLSQTQKRNAQRRRAKARVNEAARAESLASSSGAKKQDFSKDRKS